MNSRSILTPFLTIALLFTTMLSGVAQNRMSRSSLCTQRKELVAKDLNLTPVQKEFLFEQMDKLDTKKFELWKTQKELRDAVRAGTATEEQTAQLIKQTMINREKCAAMEKEFYDALSSKLTAKQIWSVHRAYKSFGKHKLQSCAKQGKKGCCTATSPARKRNCSGCMSGKDCPRATRK